MLRRSFQVAGRAARLAARARVAPAKRGYHALRAVANTPRRLALRPASSRGMASTVEFKLADIGEGITECEVMQWFVQPGDTIAQFDKVCEVQSDKATVEITSRYDGVVQELNYGIGDMAIVGEPLLTLQVEGDVAEEGEPGAKKKRGKKPAKSAAPATSSVTATDHSAKNSKVLTSPAVRRLAKENNIDLTLIAGSAPKGRVTKEDVIIFMRDGPSAAPAVPTPAPVAPTPTSAPPVYSREDQVIPVNGLQRIMVKTMMQAHAVPTMGYCDEIEMDNLMALRAHCKPLAEARGVKLSYFPFILKATSLALSQFPMMNAHVNADCSEVTYKGSHNIGMAMDTPRGLLVPNIKNVQDKSVIEIAEDLNRLMLLGKEGKLGKEDLTGGTFTLSNIGAIGGTYASPILVVPEVCIGALGKMMKVAKFNPDGSVRPSTIMNISWSADHRVLDGATAARFSNAWKDYLENPGTMILG